MSATASAAADVSGGSIELKPNPIHAGGSVKERCTSEDSYSEFDPENATTSAPGSGRAPKSRKRVVALGVGACVLLAVVALVVVLASTSRRAAQPLAVPHTFALSFTSNTRVKGAASSNGAVTGGLHKTVGSDGQWDLSGVAQIVSHGQQQRVTLVDKRAYLEVFDSASGKLRGQGCLTASDMPLFGAFTAALDNTVPMSPGESLPRGAQGCPEATAQWQFTFDAQTYILCQLPDGDMVVNGASLAASVFNVDSSVSPVSPYGIPTNTSSGKPLECPQLPFAVTTRRRLADDFFAMPDNTDDAEFMGRCFPPPAGPIRAEEDASGLEEEPSQDPGHTGRRRRRRHHHGRRMKQFWPYSPDGVVPENFLDPPEQRLFQDDMPLCIMVHGAGTEETVSTNPIPPFVDYWGDSNLRASAHCHETRYVHSRWVEKPWDDPGLQQAFCDQIHDYNNFASVLVYSHGTGTLAVALALERGVCSVSTRPLFWIDLQASYPLENLAYLAEEFCRVYLGLPAGSDPVGDELNRDFNLCGSAGVNAVWDSLRTTPVPASLRSVIATNVAGAMCGWRAEGLMGSMYAFLLEDDWTPPGLDLVDWSPCWDATFEPFFEFSHINPFYSAAINYIDVTGRNDDGQFGTDRQPVTYQLNMAYYAYLSVHLAYSR